MNAPSTGSPGALGTSGSPDAPEKGPKLGFLSQLAMATHLDGEACHDIAHEPAHTWKVGVVVAAAGFARGSVIYPESGVAGVVLSVVIGLATWVVVSALVWRIGHLFGASGADFGSCVRGVGFGAWPLVLLPVSFAAGDMPYLRETIHGGLLLAAVYNAWLGTRAALDLGLARAGATLLLSLAIVALPLALLGA